MPAYGKNELSIRPLSNGRYLLHGYIDGKQLRKRSTDLAALTEEKTKHELAQLAKKAALANREELRATWQSPEQMRDAEASHLMLGEREVTLQECVKIALQVIDTAAKPVKCLTVLDEWQAEQKLAHVRKVTIDHNRRVIRQFLNQCHAEMVGEITAKQIRDFVYAEAIAPMSQLNRAYTLNAYCNFATAHGYLRGNPSLVKVKDLKAAAMKALPLPRIVSPAQARALLEAACATDGGRLVPFVILSVWCFMRMAEVGRTLADAITLDGERSFVAIVPHKRGVSYRNVTIPANVRALLQACFDRGILAKGEFVPFSSEAWRKIRVAAGLMKFDRRDRHGRQRFGKEGNLWQSNLLRHSGISYHFNQPRPLGGDIAETCRQAGNSPAIAFKHYMKIPKAGEAEAFYAITASLPAVAPAAVPAQLAA